VREMHSLSLDFDFCRFSFKHRSCNKVAQSLAQLAHTKPNRVWIEEVLVILLLCTTIITQEFSQKTLVNKEQETTSLYLNKVEG
jgi:hypothetical protein